MAFSGIPLPKVVRDIGEGGPVVDAMLGANALSKSNLDLAHQKLINQYYAPNIQSEINQRNTLTKGYEIANQYAPDRLRLANELAQLTNKYYAPNIQSEINSRNALTNKTNQMTPLDVEKQRLENQKSLMEYSREKQFEDRFNAAINQNRPVNTNMPVNQNSMNQIPMNQYTPINQNSMNQIPISQNIPANINPQNNNFQPTVYNGVQQANPNEQIISQGSPQLSPIDDLYENSPMDRPILEKKGFKKVQQIKTDKSGKATLITKYPSGKITVSSINPNSTDENGIPLTNKMISQHQNVVSSVDVAIPVLDKIIDMKDSEYSRFGGYTNKGAKYSAVVSQALDSLLGAFGLPQTNEGIKTIREQLEIGHNESPSAYRKRIKELKEDILKRQKYSAGLVKKAIKITGNENENDPYNLDTYDLSGE